VAVQCLEDFSGGPALPAQAAGEAIERVVSVALRDSVLVSGYPPALRLLAGSAQHASRDKRLVERGGEVGEVFDSARETDSPVVLGARAMDARLHHDLREPAAANVRDQSLGQLDALSRKLRADARHHLEASRYAEGPEVHAARRELARRIGWHAQREALRILGRVRVEHERSWRRAQSDVASGGQVASELAES
jgi:hypothetical protein